MAQTSTLLNFLFRKNRAKLLLLLLFTCMAGFADAQSVEIFRETLGSNGVGNGSISQYQGNGYFDNDNLTFGGTATVASQSPSTYTGASGGNYFMATRNQFFTISGINTVDFESLALSFGVYRASNAGLTVEYSVDGNNWIGLSSGSNPTSAVWEYKSNITDDVNGAKLPKTSNLSLRFTNTGTGVGQLRIDDIKLTGISVSVQPVISGFTPKRGGKGTIVTIYGKNLQNTDPSSVYFTVTEDVHELLSVSSDSLKIRLTGGSGAQTLALYTIDGKFAESAEAFTYIEPKVTSFQDAAGTTITEATQGTRITLVGTDLGSTYSVVFEGGATATPISTSSTKIVVDVPQGASTGRIQVQTSMYGVGYSTDNITILKPEIFSLSPTSGKIYDEVTITGSRLNIGTYKVYFSGVSGPVETEIITAAGDGTSLKVAVPLGAVTGPITVTTDEGSAVSGTFTVLAPQIVFYNTEYLTTFTTAAGTPSEAQYYQVAGYNLGGGITITAPQSFEISKTGADGTWVKSFFYPLGADGSVEQQPVYIRYVPTVTGSNSGYIVHSSDGVTKSLLINGTAAAPLPVELISFKAQKQDEAVLLTWATASEKDNAYFDVEVTNDAKGEFKAVGKVNSKATNSSVKTNYQFSHAGSFTGTRYYRLKQVDLDGTTSYSNVVAVEMTAQMQQTVKVAPNPISPESKLLFPAAEAGKLNISIVNMSGSKVAAKSADVEAGVNTIELGLSEKLPAGMYILTTEFNGKTEQVKLIKR